MLQEEEPYAKSLPKSAWEIDYSSSFTTVLSAA